MNAVKTAMPLLIAGLLAHAGLESAQAQTDSYPRINSVGSGPIVQDKITVLESCQVVDPLSKNVACQVLVPQGWQATGGMAWDMLKANLVNLELRIADPQSAQQVEFLPNLLFTWIHGGILFFPRGSNYLGQEVQPPVADAAAYVKEYILPRYRKGIGARVVDVMALPKLAKATLAADSAGSARASAARVRIEYLLNGQPVEEDIYAILVAAQLPIAGQPAWFWGSEKVFAIRSAKGQLDADSGLLLAIANSPRVNLTWFADYQNALQIWRSIQANASNQALVRSRIIAQSNNEVTAIIRAKYENHQAAMARIHQQFSNYIRGVEQYQNPDGGYPITLPSGYSNVWGNSLGRYVLSNNPNFNPNVGSNLNWKRLEVVR